jgi:hypothetical protein
LVVSGDQLDRSRPQPFGLAGCNQGGESHQYDRVVAAGSRINGSSHMMMMDTNNGQIFDLLEGWIQGHAFC